MAIERPLWLLASPVVLWCSTPSVLLQNRSRSSFRVTLVYAMRSRGTVTFPHSWLPASTKCVLTFPPLSGILHNNRQTPQSQLHEDQLQRVRSPPSPPLVGPAAATVLNSLKEITSTFTSPPSASRQVSPPKPSPNPIVNSPTLSPLWLCPGRPTLGSCSLLVPEPSGCVCMTFARMLRDPTQWWHTRRRFSVSSSIRSSLIVWPPSPRRVTSRSGIFVSSALIQSSPWTLEVIVP
mmetsp:Transcript_52009/g.130583  ORF Transcript_52009/g.130583 Transcript_52009/m.130583 type:complete len:236 (+) Transcript_52009:379-1086(+)